MTVPAGFDPQPFVESVPWRFAKTMVYMPHEYLVQGKVPDEDGFWAFVAYIAATRLRGALAPSLPVVAL